MNKKLIAVAVATIMAAPVAMADIKISGKMSKDFISKNDAYNSAATAAVATTAVTGGAGANNAGDPVIITQGKDAKASNAEDADSGTRELTEEFGNSRLQIDFSEGKTFGRMAFHTFTGSLGFREQYIGYKFDGAKVTIGRMGTVHKNVEKDPLITSFMQLRLSYAEAATAKNFGSSGFIDNLVQVSGKSGGMKWAVATDLTSNTDEKTEGHLAVGVSGKASGVTWWAGYNNGSGNNGADVTPTATDVDQSNIKVGASMKFGKVKATLNYSAADDGADNAKKWNATALSASMGLGGGASIHATVATTAGNSDAESKEGTTTRLAYAKKLNKAAKVYAGVRTDDPKADGADTKTTYGVGFQMNF